MIKHADMARIGAKREERSGNHESIAYYIAVVINPMEGAYTPFQELEATNSLDPAFYRVRNMVQELNGEFLRVTRERDRLLHRLNHLGEQH